MSESQTRVGGSGWTAFTWRGQRLAWMQVLSDRAAAPVAAAQVIQPMDAEHPVEIVTARAVGAGTLSLTSFERWNAQVWQELAGLEAAKSILDIFKQQVNLGNVSCRKVIKNPTGPYRTKVYYNCVITDADESETLNIGTMTLPKSLTIMYTHADYL